VAEHLQVEFSVLVSRKLPYVQNVEAGFGAIAEDDSLYLFEDAVHGLTSAQIARIIEEQKRVVARTITVLRKERPLPRIKDRSVFLVDDGIAMGSTMYAAVQLCLKKRAGEIIIATPVASQMAALQLKKVVDHVVALDIPPEFKPVAQSYSEWHDVSDREAIELLDRYQYTL
jgi:predicted phosphoribosyltransferase